MSILFFLSLLIPFPNSAYSQLDGCYCHENRYNKTCMTFYPNRLFSYKQTGTNGFFVGKGTYELKNGHLILSFETDSSLIPIPIIEFKEKTTLNSQDTVLLTINVLCKEDKQAILYPIAYYTDTLNQIISGGEGNEKGEIELRIAKSNNTYICFIEAVAMEKIHFKFHTLKSYDITCYMLTVRAGKTFISGDKKAFQHKKLGRRKLLLKSEYGYAVYETYVKTRQ